MTKVQPEDVSQRPPHVDLRVELVHPTLGRLHSLVVWLPHVRNDIDGGHRQDTLGRIHARLPALIVDAFLVDLIEAFHLRYILKFVAKSSQWPVNVAM